MALHRHQHYHPRPLGACFFFFNDTATTELYTLSLHDALPIFINIGCKEARKGASIWCLRVPRSEEHTSELQSPCNLVCRLLLEKKKRKTMLFPIRSLVDGGRDQCPAHLPQPRLRGRMAALRRG